MASPTRAIEGLVLIDIAQWAEDNLDRVRRSGGQELTATCPSCDAAPGRFYLNTETGAFICFKEDEFRSKRVWALIAHVEGITIAQARAEAMRDNVKFARRRKGTLATLAERVAALRGRDVEDGNAYGRVAAPLPRGFVPIHSGKRRRVWMRPRYLKERGVKKDTCREFGLGYVQAGEWYEPESGERSQYIGERIIIPILSPTGYSWSARDITGEQQPKYLNPRGADHRRLLHGWDQVDLSSDIVIVEGPLDVIGMYQHGIPALAILGKELNREQLGLLCTKPADASITVMMDPEEPEAPFNVARELTTRFSNIFIGTLPDGVDPGDATRAQAWKGWDDSTRYTGQRTSGLMAKLQKLNDSR